MLGEETVRLHPNRTTGTEWLELYNPFRNNTLDLELD